MIRLLDPVPSIKVKLGLVVVGSVAVTVAAVVLGTGAGLPGRVTVPLGVLVSLATVQVLARGTTSPLREMAAAARRMARGDHDVRVTATSRDEVGELARAFNSMAAELARVDEQRRRLVADVSHELRTPLTALQAVLENIADGVAEPDAATLDSALAQTRRLSRLVTSLLDLSRLEAGEVPLRLEPLELGPFAAEVARGTGGRVEVDVEDGLVVPADPERLHQVLANLLDNALRHAPPGRAVRVVGRHTEGGARLEVQDDGPGVAPADRERVFERFTRTDSARTSRDGGSGLGLAIVRWVVDLHGGAVHLADPRPPSTGCRVVVDLPRRAR
ncbi:MAG TPA: ATP-binding protein [Mycobacteriales bacterium]|nr:ATP-binding protein [Mycobacteriales bacterium]